MSQENLDSIVHEDLSSRPNEDNTETNGLNSSIVDLDAVSGTEVNEKEIVDLTNENAEFIDLTEDDGAIETLPESSGKQRRKRRKRSHSYFKTKRFLDDSIEVLPSPSANSANKKIVCPVCMDDSDHITQDTRHLVSTICGHIFCNRCLQESIRVHHKCPTCRNYVNKKKYHKLFL